MRKPVLLLLLASLALPACAAKPVTVEQLERLLAADRGKPDLKVAEQLAGLEIAERLSSAKFSRWEAALPGPESRRALLILADVSAFLDPPASEIPATATPDLATQRLMMAAAVSYATKTILKLPDFFAKRDTIFFADSPQTYRADMSAIAYQPLHPVSRSSDTVLYRGGREVVDQGTEQHKKQEPEAQGLTTSGVFGPILGTVLVDAGQGKLVWSHWEQGASGPVGVFRFEVAKEKSHYEVAFCCVAGDGGSGIFKQYSGYHGEIAVDPMNGTILRLKLEADLKPADPLRRSDILVKYGPVEIGGTTYFCPAKSISITLAPALRSLEMQRYRGSLLDADVAAAREHLQTLLNDVAFVQYHLFRAESRILTGDNAVPMDTMGSTAPAGAMSPTEEGPSRTSAAAAPSADIVEPAPTQSSATQASAAVASGAEVAPPPVPAPGAPVPEIAVAESAGLPQPSATTPTLTPGADFTLRVTSRLVDVGVLAVDKKGHPVTDLRPENFEVFDNSRKQAVRLFSRAGEKAEAESSLAPSLSGSTANERSYTNRRADLVDAKLAAEATESSVTILLIDSSSLAWADLSYAREEMLKFLEKVPLTARVGLYVRSASGFQILVEETRDHGQLAARLRQWMPHAQDLASAQELETRNRQQFDDVLHVGDLQQVNGSTETWETTTMVDPQLRNYGSNPGRTALSILVGVARHLAAIPGHKNLVWVASDNVLADWQDKAVGTDKGSKQIEGFVLRAQEALNDSQVSVYPLDASQLETMATDSSLANSSVELSPSVTVPPGETPQSGVAGPGLGRAAAEMQQDIHPIQGAIQQLAEATGGRIFRRSGNIAMNLDTVVADGRAVYLLGFAPDTPADDKYHVLTVKPTGRRGVKLRYRAGYQYSREPATLKDRFQQAIWKSLDLSEIGISANAGAASQGTTLKLKIATNDLALKQQGDRWMDKLDIFLVRRDDEGLHARITEQTLRLMLKSDTYAKLMREGIPFDQFIEKLQNSGSLRIIVVDENSGSMGSVTVPAVALKGEN